MQERRGGERLVGRHAPLLRAGMRHQAENGYQHHLQGGVWAQ
jgi:hypothetical protein